MSALHSSVCASGGGNVHRPIVAGAVVQAVVGTGAARKASTPGRDGTSPDGPLDDQNSPEPDEETRVDVRHVVLLQVLVGLQQQLLGDQEDERRHPKREEAGVHLRRGRGNVAQKRPGHAPEDQEKGHHRDQEKGLWGHAGLEHRGAVSQTEERHLNGGGHGHDLAGAGGGDVRDAEEEAVHEVVHCHGDDQAPGQRLRPLRQLRGRLHVAARPLEAGRSAEVDAAQARAAHLPRVVEAGRLAAVGGSWRRQRRHGAQQQRLPLHLVIIIITLVMGDGFDIKHRHNAQEEPRRDGDGPLQPGMDGRQVW
eukprot:CAMPEP_0174326796 /NCGR_PEP_ID=MMETSP0810-20121108/14124_1 /TAXON_ID=73025 ORGANISM="Eutreptiella gymnastica-like, Strain CCMP1594" /NCGR_SAMPLE_ID=MMETSP0810 /ASSEMBLY_ACC=CAM_ASM_000659 /LENGTH=308 /DNA_ID=CAMNT_0015440499 /DNA_START=760 /DNA_END=1684 /DNA_ORIENTATION=+